MLYKFEEFELDPGQFELRHGATVVRMEPQVFDVLRLLVENHGRVLTKDEIMEQVWGDKYISEAALNSRLMAARKAIGDNGREQRLIRTVHGRGYRFVGAVEALAEPPAPVLEAAPPPSMETGPLASHRAGPIARAQPAYGREAEMVLLRLWLDEATTGRRQVVFLTGEAGIGKTTLLHAFAGSLGDARPLVALGQCLEQQEAGEPYLPVFDALGRACREPAAGSLLVDTLVDQAPTWASQMPGVLSAEQLARAQQRSAGATRDRMLREILSALESLAARRPLLLLLEDLHWSDPSTLDLISALARRSEPARVMLIGTYRPSEARVPGLPLDRLKDDLRVRSLCRELALPPLPADAAGRYIAESLSVAAVPDGLAQAIQRRCEGNPLFMHSLFEELTARGWDPGAAGADEELESIFSSLPPGLQALIDQQFERLAGDEQELLGAASVAGPEFSALELAAALDGAIEGIETRCDRLARQGGFILQAVGPSAEWPDGSLAGRYRFVHGLYQEALYDGLPPAVRARLHQRIAERLEAAYGALAGEHAAELARHFSRGRDRSRSITYLHLAAEQAARRGAFAEAAAELRRALGLVESDVQLPDRPQEEMRLQASLGSVLLAMGLGSQEPLTALRRALDLAEELGDAQAAANVVFSLASLLEFRSDHHEAEGLLKQFQPDQMASEGIRLPYHALLTCAYFHQGAFRRSVDQGAEGLALLTASAPDERVAFLGEDPGMGCSEWSAEALWFLGYADEALKRLQVALDLADAPGRGFTRTSSQGHAARIHQYRREPVQTSRYALASLSMGAEYGYAYSVAVAKILVGWATAALGNASLGVTEIKEGIAAHRATGAAMDRPYFLALLAEALLVGADSDEALAVVRQALDEIPADRSFFYEAELHRLRGLALLNADTSEARRVAESSFRTALEIARAQESRALELRAAMSLARVMTEDGRRAEARDLLQPVYAWFTEGLDTPDLVEARELLAGLR